MKSGTVAILGIPTDNLIRDETVARMFSKIEAYQRDQRPRQVAVVFVVRVNQLFPLAKPNRLFLIARDVAVAHWVVEETA